MFPQLIPCVAFEDETCASSDWSQVQPAHAEVLILNLQTEQYTFPELMEKMSKLKALIVINHGFRPSELNNFELLSSLSNLKRIRLERIFVPSFVDAVGSANKGRKSAKTKALSLLKTPTMSTKVN